MIPRCSGDPNATKFVEVGPPVGDYTCVVPQAVTDENVVKNIFKNRQHVAKLPVSKEGAAALESVRLELLEDLTKCPVTGLMEMDTIVAKYPKKKADKYRKA